MKSRSVRTLAVLASTGLILGAFVAGPADAAKKKKKPAACAPYATAVEAAAEAPVVQVSEAATEEAPVVVEFEHPASLVQEHPALPDTQDSQYANIQVTSKAPAGLYVKVEFDSRHDIDLYLYDDAAKEVASSGAFNAAPVDAGVLDFSAGGRGGETWESITGFESAPCQGFTAESTAYVSPGTPVKMTIWLGEIIAAEE